MGEIQFTTTDDVKDVPAAEHQNSLTTAIAVILFQENNIFLSTSDENQKVTLI